MMRLRRWPPAVLGAVLCFAPLTPLFWVRWMVGLFAIITLLRADVRCAFEMVESGGGPPDDGTPPTKPGGMKSAVYERSPESAPAEMSAQEDVPPAYMWTSLDESALLMGVVGAVFLAMFPFAALSGPAWDWTSTLCGLLGGFCLLGCIAFHAIRAAQRHQARQQLGSAFDPASLNWGQWWRERSFGFRQVLTTLAMVGYLACLALFLAYEWQPINSGELGVQPGSWRITLGKPTPWLWIERHAESPSQLYTQQFAIVTWSVFYAAVALGLMEVLAQTRRWEARDKRAATKTRAVLTGIALVMGLALATVVRMAA
ncbi:MAG TPA: hypothetical protein VM915_13545 [Verrucomicrobiae bacterium]|nr:hypothetical protein [Verrucomicrobiae bacterium]